MQSILLLVVGAVVGAAATFFLAGGLLIGAGAGAGLATGVKAGACMTAEAAKAKGFITAEQVGELLTAAGAQITGQAPTVDVTFAGGDQDCAKLVSDMRAAAQKSE
jgi:hypothetical protein